MVIVYCLEQWHAVQCDLRLKPKSAKRGPGLRAASRQARYRARWRWLPIRVRPRGLPKLASWPPFFGRSYPSRIYACVTPAIRIRFCEILNLRVQS
jgi:hypothetical protein